MIFPHFCCTQILPHIYLMLYLISVILTGYTLFDWNMVIYIYYGIPNFCNYDLIFFVTPTYWYNDFCLLHSNNIMLLVLSFLNSSLVNSMFQPSIYLCFISYHFDKSMYNGEETLPMLIQYLWSSCLGCVLHLKKTFSGCTQTYYQIRCHHYQIPDL